MKRKILQGWFPWICDDEIGDSPLGKAQFHFHVNYAYYPGEVATHLNPGIKPYGEITYFTCQKIVFQNGEQLPTQNGIVALNKWAIEKYGDNENLHALIKSEVE